MAEESTTPDLVGPVQRLTDAVNAGDFEAMLRFFAHDAAWETIGLGTSYHGLEEIRGFLEEWIGTFEDVRAKLEVRDVGHGVTFAVVEQHGRLRGSTGWVMYRNGAVMTWAGGLIERVTNYPDIDEARAAAERLARERG
jgi:ketosteroid isomerase-like protein